MAYGMSAAKEAGLAQTQVWKRLMGMPVDQLKAAAHGEVPGVDMNLATLALRAKMTQVADKGAQAQQQLAQAGQGSVKARMLAQADQLPEMLGIGRLPAQNMEEMAAAQGGVVGYADGGEVERYASRGLVLPEGYEMFEDPTSGEVYPRKKRAGLYDYGLSLQEKAQGIRPPAPVAPMGAATPAAGTAATGNAVAQEAAKAPPKVKGALDTVTKPAIPVEDPSKAQKAEVTDRMAGIKDLTKYLDETYGSLMDPIKAQLEKDRAEYANMKSENVGLALLGAAGALLKPGRSTASAIGEGLGTLAEYGAKFQPQMLAARQGISAGEIGLAQAQAQAARGNFSTAAQLEGQRDQAAIEREKLAMQRPYYAAYANYLSSKGAGIGGGNDLATLKAYQKSLQDDIKNFIPTSAADKSLLADKRAELNRIEQLLQSRIKGLNVGDSSPAPGSVAGSYQRP